MLNLYPAQIESLSLHRVGNKNKNETLFLSETPYALNDELVALLKNYFFKPFREKEENYFNFAHEVDLTFNEVYQAVTTLFNSPEQAHKMSQQIA
ncbi:MAG: nucleoid-associated protein, partial [Bacteroidota bacterium]